MKKFRRILSLILVLSSLSVLNGFAAGVLEQDVESPWQSFYDYKNEEYRGHSALWVFDSYQSGQVVLQIDAVAYSLKHQASMDLPTGTLGGQPRLYEDGNILIYAGSWKYNGPNGNAITAIGDKTYSLTSVIGRSFYAQCQIALYNGNGYDRYTTYATPNITVREGRAYITENGQSNKIVPYKGLDSDLIRARGINGNVGYIYESELSSIGWRDSINEKLAPVHETVVIPVYQADGKTVIDEFVVHASQSGNGNISSEFVS